jgi:hypothetical protein
MHSQSKVFEKDTIINIRNNLKLVKTGDIVRLETNLKDETFKASAYLTDFNTTLLEVEDTINRSKATHHEHLSDFHEKANIILNDINKFEIQSYLSVSELLRLRLRIMVAQREEVEELEMLEKNKSFYINKEMQTKNKVSFYFFKTDLLIIANLII